MLVFIILFNNISIVHARSRAPAWSCLFATKITRKNLLQHFMVLIILIIKIKKFYNSVMVRADLDYCRIKFYFFPYK